MAVPRAHFADVLISKTGNGYPAVLSGATVHLYETGSTTPIADTIYDTFDGNGTLANPLTADADGAVEFWLPNEKTLDLYIVASGYASKRRQVLVEHFDGG